MTTKRTKTMIKGEFQQRLIMNTLLTTLITLNLIILVSFQLDAMFGSSNDMFSVFNLSIATLELVAVGVVYYIGRRISFRIAGPVYAIERTLANVNQGDLARNLRLRPGDEFMDVAESINELIDNYRDRLIVLQQLAAEREPTPAQLHQMRQLLAWFKTSS